MPSSSDLGAELVQFPIDLADLGGPLLGAGLGLLDLLRRSPRSGLVLLLLLLELLLLGRLELLALDHLELALDLLPGRKWSAMTIQTVASSIAIEEMAKTMWRIGCGR